MKMKTFLIILSAIIYSCNNQTTHNIIYQNHNDEDNCLTIDNFNKVKEFILTKGEKIKLFKVGIIADTTTLSTQLLLENKTIVFIENESRIIVIKKNDKETIPIYFVSKKNNSCEISAYYSVLDTDESIKLRKDDWCEVVMKINKL